MSNPHKPHANVWLQIYVACTASLGVALFVWSLSAVSPALPDVLLFVALVALAEWTNIEVLSSEIAFSISAPILVASLILFGPLVAALVGIVGGLVTTMVRAYIDRRQNRTRQTRLGQRVLFNLAVMGVSIAISGWVYLLLGGQTGRVTLFTDLTPIVLASALNEFVNAWLVIGAVSLQTGRRAFPLWVQNMSWAVPMNILGMSIGGGALAWAHEIAGPAGTAVFFLPVVCTIYAYRLYVRQTKAQMARLEAIVAEGVRAHQGQKGNPERA